MAVNRGEILCQGAHLPRFPSFPLMELRPGSRPLPISGNLSGKTFLDIVLACKPSHFRPSDLPLLAAYCRAIVLERQASNALAVAGHVTEDGRVSPWMKVWEQANKAMLSLARWVKALAAGA